MIERLSGILKQLGVSESILLGLAILALIFGLISAVVKFIQWAILKNHQWLLNENLRPYFSNNDVDRATRYYISTKFQNVSPTAEDEPGKSYLASAKQLLMPMFLNKAFKDNHDNTKYYLILADAGMGKTTFLINLFLNYTNRPIKNLFGINRNQEIKLLPLGSPDIWDDINDVENKRETILLLDAFDEDIKAVDNYDLRMREFLRATREFKQVIITCRTQFFPSDKEIPDDTGYTTFGGEQESYKFQRVYLSVFDESDIRKYLKKRFSIFQYSKRRKAFEIVKKSPNLVMRPMLLSYINDFVEADKTFNHSYEIYEVLIEKWIERESKKHGIRQKYGSEQKYRELLLNFSQALAKNLYEKRTERGGYFITEADFIKDTPEFQITDLDTYGMTETEIRSKSLLNRNAEGQYKFSHKSILEYFLAKELIQDSNFLSKFDFDGMSATEMFLNERLEPFRKLDAEYLTIKSDIYLDTLEFSVNHLVKIEELTIVKLKDFDLSQILLIPNLKHLVIRDHPIYAFLYFGLMGRIGWLDERSKEPYDFIPDPGLGMMGPPMTAESLDREQLWELRRLLELLKRLKISETTESIKSTIQYKTQVFGYTDAVQKRFSKLNDDEIIKRLQPSQIFLEDILLLKEKMPNCEIVIYVQSFDPKKI